MSQANTEKRPRNLSIADKLRGVRILIVAPSLTIMGGQAVQADLLIKNLRKEGVDVGFQPHNPKPWWPLYYLCHVKYVRTLIVSIFYVCGLLLRVPRYDVIHIFSASYRSFVIAPTPAILISRLFRKKIILNYRSGEAEDHFTRSGKRIFWIIRKVDKILVPSEYLVGVFKQFGFDADFIYNVSDFNTFKYRRRDSIAPKILVARNLEPLYDIETAIRSFVLFKDKYPDAEMTITGNGSDERRLKQLVKDEEIDGIKFTGRVERSQIGALFDESDIFLNTSVIDNMPVAIIEAFYSGLPVVTTNAGGIPFIVRHRENGLLAPMRDHVALADALCQVCDGAVLRAKLIACGRADALKCSWEEVKYKWADAYCELARSNGKTGETGKKTR